MRPLNTLAALGALLLSAGEALPCGGAFGPSYTIDPAQKIVVAYRDGNETYVFNPRFCGQAESFGLILPVPAPLTANPTLGSAELYADLAGMTAPTIVTRCSTSLGAGGKAAASGTGGGKAGTGGTTVIDRGQVGIFDWALLQATSVTSFTDWLDANGFPYQPSAVTAFQYYVDGGWYFVAFKVSAGAGTSGGSGGSGAGGVFVGTGGKGGVGGLSAQICGNFGPILLSFPAPEAPVVPARIASVSSTSLSWTIYTLAAEQLRARNVSQTLRFSGAVGPSELETHPGVTPLAREGDRLTELLVTSAPSQDFVLEPNPSPTDYRREEIQYVVCSGGTASAGGAPGTSGTTPSTGGISSGGRTSPPPGTPSTGGTQSQGGAPGSVSLPTGGSAEKASSRDEGGCSVGPGRHPHPTPGLVWLAALVGLGAWARKRRRS
jgi:MYXO-CTERM domain-containing protein